MRAPELTVLKSAGDYALLSELYASEPVALVFLRHLGCIFCREQISQLNAHPELNIYFVTMSPADESEQFRTDTKSPHRFIADPEKDLYRAFDLAVGTMAQLLNPTTFARGFKATLAGHTQSRPTSDPKQLGAAFVISPGGEVTWEKRAAHAADAATPAELAKALGSVNAKV
jgi:peroxiredoxin